MIFAEYVFDDWSVTKIYAYLCQQDLCDYYSQDDVCTLLETIPSPPCGFLSLCGQVYHTDPYWNETDLQDDLQQLRTEHASDDVLSTLALSHDQMCEFLCILFDEMKKS